jgi:hypothetical protein
MSSDETYRDNLRQELEGAIRTSWFRIGKVVSALVKISQYKDADMIKDIIPLLWAKEEAVFFETVATVSLLLQQVPIEKLPDFDWGLRRSWPYCIGNRMLAGVEKDRLTAINRDDAWGPDARGIAAEESLTLALTTSRGGVLEDASRVRF